MGFIDTFIQTHPAQTIKVADSERTYIVGGKGCTAFLIFPGSGQDALSCYDLIDVFEKKYKAIAVNYDGLFSVSSFFEYVNAILEHEKVTKVILYGLSLGGFLAQHYLRKYPAQVEKTILSHTASTRSKTIKNRVSRPGKLLYFFIPVIPQALLNKLFKPLAGRVQSGKSDYMMLYEKYSTRENLEKRLAFAKKTTFSMIDKKYLKTIYCLGTDMERLEKNFTRNDLENWKGRLLIIRTDNDPLAQDDGIFKEYYPQAQVITFNHTGHLTPFIRFEEMAEEINKFIKS